MNQETGNKYVNTKEDYILSIPPYKVQRLFYKYRYFVPEEEVIDWGLEMLGIPSLWRLTNGSGIKVAVLDTGIDPDHPDLSGAIAEQKDFTNSRSGCYDVIGHGTHVAGIIAAQRNGIGIVGIAPEVKLLIGKVIDYKRRGRNRQLEGSIRHLVDGIYWAIDQGANIINMSLGTNLDIDKIHKAVRDAYEQNVIVICAAGNRMCALNAVDYPAKYPETVAVGAIDINKKTYNKSSHGTEVTIVAPGVDIISTYPRGEYAKLSGTSMAAPFVTGVAALMLAKHKKYGGKTPLITPGQFIEHLKKTAIDLGQLGPDMCFGWGLINPESLLKLKLSKYLQLMMKEDFTESGIRKLEKFFNEKIQSMYQEDFFEDNIIWDKAREVRCRILLDFSNQETHIT